MRQLTTLGYLVGVITVLALAVLPRGKFIQNMILNCLATAVGCAMAMLINYTAVQARLNTSDLREMAAFIQANGRAPYNSSQSAVCGVWLFFQIWLSNVIRAKYPAFNVPVIIYSIVVNISCTFGPEFPTLATAEAFIQRLLTAIFSGLAIATVVSLVIFPISSRQVVAKQMASVLGLFKKSIVLEKQYLQGLEKEDMFALEITETSAGRSEPERKGGKKDTGPKLTKEQKNALALRGTIGAIRELMGKIYGDMKFAKRDIAWGHLSAKDFGEMFNLIRMCVIPMTGIGTIMDIFQRVGRERGWDGEGPGDGGLFQRFQPIGKEESQRIWNDIMKQLHEPFEILSEAITQGIDHAGVLLKLFPQPKAQKKAAAQKSGADADVEASGGGLRPGQVGFSSVINAKIETFNSRKGEILRLWAKDKGLCSDGNFENWAQDSTRLFEKRRNDQAQLYVILYLEKLMQATGEAVQDLVAFAEAKAEDGTMTKKRLIFPSGRRLRKWFLGIFSNEDSTAEDSPDIMETGTNVVYLGQGWMNKKDPEHLPATNAWERFGNGVRRFSRFFGSPESVFGFRVACATMTIGIIAFLESSQRFFIQQRLVWAMIIIAIGMTQSKALPLPFVTTYCSLLWKLTFFSVRPIYIWLPLTNRRDIYRHGQLFHHLLHRRPQSTRDFRLSLAFHLYRILFLLQISAIHTRRYDLHRHPGSSSPYAHRRWYLKCALRLINISQGSHPRVRASNRPAWHHSIRVQRPTILPALYTRTISTGHRRRRCLCCLLLDCVSKSLHRQDMASKRPECGSLSAR